MSKNYNSFKKSRLRSLYFAIAIMIIGFGLTYSMVFFVYNQDILTGRLTVLGNAIDVEEEIMRTKKLLASSKSSYIAATKDSVGLSNGKSRTFNVTNNGNKNVMLQIKINPTTSNTIALTDMRFGLYLNGDLKKVDYVEKDNSTIIYEGMLLANEKLNVSIKFWLDYYSTIQSGTFDVSISFGTKTSQRMLVDEISNSTDEDVVAINSDGSLYEGTGNKVGYYYTGKNPNNYVWFNCDTGYYSGKDHCELWRIVSSTNIKASEYSNEYQRVKIVRDTALASEKAFNNNNYYGSDIYVYLNNEYYNVLSNKSKKMVLKSLWYYGNIEIDDSLEFLYDRTYNSVSNYIGILSAKDYLHTVDKRFYGNGLNSNDSINNTWLSNSRYLLIDNVGSNYLLVNDGSISTNSSNSLNKIRPSLYLSPSIYVRGGKGTLSDPYRLDIDDESNYYEDVEVV